MWITPNPARHSSSSLAFQSRIQLPIDSRLGLSGHAVVKAFSGRAREISWLTYLLATVLVLYFVLVRSRIG